MNSKAITFLELQRALHDGQELALLDVREDGEFGEGHLLFAIPLPYSVLELRVFDLVPRQSVRIVLCDDGVSGVAEQAQRRLASLGYTDCRVLTDGLLAAKAQGHPIFKGVNVPSKLFGELVEHVYGTPRITARQLSEMRAAGEDLVVIDGRPLHEHHKMTIPGSVCCPNGELPYRISDLVKQPSTKVVINCAGRTRSILGAQTLINFGLENPVFALENGTQGWALADLDLEYGSQRRYPGDVNPEALDADTLARRQEAAKKLMEQHQVPWVTAETLNQWRQDGTRSTYLCDVRTPAEFAHGSMLGAVNAPGGQLIQATDQWIGVRRARVVVVDGGDHIRAPSVASWLRQLGHETYVLDVSTASEILPGTPRQWSGAFAKSAIAAPELAQEIDRKQALVIDVGPSMDFRRGHIPGTRWVSRRDLERTVASVMNQRPDSRHVVLVADDDQKAQLAMTELEALAQETPCSVRFLEGGLQAWRAANLPLETTPDQPSDAECIDFLFFVHDRHSGNREAMRQYLAWETGLMAQVTEDDKKLFTLYEQVHGE
jgi:rhodanese-related sulfurtransferase